MRHEPEAAADAPSSGACRRAPSAALARPLLLALLLLAACAAPADDAADAADTAAAPQAAARADSAPPPAPGVAPTDPAPADSEATSLLAHADSAVRAIADRDWAALAALAHPERGVRFAPYGHVEPDGECTVTLGRAALARLGADRTVRCWGSFDGTGEPITMAFADYYARFVYDEAYRKARRGRPDERIGEGNTLSNVPDFFGPGARFVEYHVPGSDRYSGMDWGSLRLVFVPHAGGWALVGIVHDQWTI